MPVPPQDVPPSNRVFAGNVFAVGLRSGPKTGQAQLPKKDGFDGSYVSFRFTVIRTAFPESYAIRFVVIVHG